MKLVSKPILLFLSAFFLLTLLFVNPLYAAKKFSLSPKVGLQVAVVFELYELGKSSQALAKISKIRPRSAFDKAYIQRFKGNLFWEAGEEKKALQALEIAVAENALADKEQQQSQRMLADLYLNQKQTVNAIKLYKQLIVSQPSEDLYKHLAITYYQQKSWLKLVDATHNAIKLSREFNQSVHILQLSALYELKDYKRASQTLLKLTKQDPIAKRWWMQLASTYRLLKQDKKALATYELAYQQGFISSSSEIKQLASFRAALGAPYQAALLLESAINNQQVSANAKSYKMLAMFWQVAREHDKAQQYWGKSAVLSGNTLHYLTQVQLLHLLGRYDKMLTVLAMIKPDSITLQGKVALTQVQALFELKKYQQAKRIANAYVDNPSCKKRALQWVRLLETRTQNQFSG
ncbi:tetratricopeptide repeat protein [Psychromonas hadalis]|uniref:tetratricopeptide repeat protein n=1 Tax=Psychromonas hadalis TaxID=211669 RepID=UPI0003B745A1|nr:tetratricopeptide repeat protein [Psychromonas hadalis]